MKLRFIIALFCRITYIHAKKIVKSSQLPAQNPSRSIQYWKILQGLFWGTGLAIFGLLVFLPRVGLILFWNILIPAAPALLVIATGVWRNLCPLASTAMLPARLGISRKKQLTITQQQTLNLLGVLFLFFLIPLRHVIFNISGQATALVIFSLSVMAVSAGVIFESRSAWCAGLCPIQPVERLYGSSVGITVPNAQCGSCIKCSIPCPDSTKNITIRSLKSRRSLITEILLAGGFPGFIWGWFQVPDYFAGNGLGKLYIVYGYPLLGAAVTIALYITLKRRFPENRRILVNIFGAAAVSCYYWFRLPQLLGFTNVPSSGILVDLSAVIPSWTLNILRLATTGFFVWWMIIENQKLRSWSKRPPYARRLDS
ncbi:MAG: hypothetical protein KGM98_00085 [Bacteroidota bacterium]|nr:hypothetical protein [Bacteroidota bacterium]